MGIRDEVIKNLKQTDLNRDERVLFSILGERFYDFFQKDLCGNFYLSHISSKRDTIRRVMQKYLEDGKKIDLVEWSRELGLSISMLEKIYKSLQPNQI